MFVKFEVFNPQCEPGIEPAYCKTVLVNRDKIEGASDGGRPGITCIYGDSTMRGTSSFSSILVVGTLDEVQATLNGAEGLAGGGKEMSEKTEWGKSDKFRQYTPFPPNTEREIDTWKKEAAKFFPPDFISMLDELVLKRSEEDELKSVTEMIFKIVEKYNKLKPNGPTLALGRGRLNEWCRQHGFGKGRAQ